MSDTAQEPDWWLASDGKWYPPQSAAPAAAGWSAAPVTTDQQVAAAVGRRQTTDYIFDYWTALGWTLLTFGVYGIYVFYQLMRRMRDHNVRRLELLEAANSYAWEEAGRQGAQDQLRTDFEAVARSLAVLRHMTTEFREPVVWLVFYLFGSTVVNLVAFVLLDGDLVDHGIAEDQAQRGLARIYGRLGRSLPEPGPPPDRRRHRYAARIVVTIVSFGVYLFWWYYNMMDEPNRHFEANWAWEDALTSAVQEAP